MRAASVVVVAAAALLVTGCASYLGSTLPAQLKSWDSTTDFWPQVRIVLRDAGNVATAEQQGDPATIRDVCQVLSNDTRGAHQLLPSPSPELSNGLEQALELEGAAAGDCFRAAGTAEGATRSRADGERTRAGVALGAACALFDRLSASSTCADELAKAAS